LEARNRLKKAEDVSDFSDIEKTKNVYQRKEKNVPLSPENDSNEIGIGCPTISNVISKLLNILML